ncbi:hypothetical protein G3480_14670 [Thiorhodococcus mannitoliphagus]|uniref:Pilus assembly protein PilW n=1 Tax=Thiorhodococcus mannitoliphagus TaxID=329406 RepID=A0A6P1DT94_9GAMM|nr:hypothetical protein [Thiorhodococcus mannitoliphagus]NEX21537.1 hypothetical protein [Thiorhodococcus mannitoliphagus]
MTLSSLMVGLAAGTLTLTATLSTYLMISEGARDTLMEARLNQELRAALNLMQSDIRRAGYWDSKDADHDGDANADGVFDWRDFGANDSPRGAFDTDGDGDSDADDLTPIHNPFQRRYNQVVNNDLCTDTDAETGDCTAPRCIEHTASGSCRTSVQSGHCITYSYDLDADGRVGIRACDRTDSEDDCPRPTGRDGGAPFAAHNAEPYAWRAWYPPDAQDKTKSIEMEMFGFRYRDGSVSMRVGRFGKEDLSFGCNTGRWERITSPDIRITNLEFLLTTSLQNANATKPATAPCESGDLCRQIRSVKITISGQVAEDPSTASTLSTIVAVRNHRYEVTE